MTDHIREYWDRRAAAASGPNATTDDIHLRRLEQRAVLEALRDLVPPSRGSALDLGCGDGVTTLALAEAFPGLSWTGVDFAPEMIRLAQRHSQEAGPSASVQFIQGDVRHLSSALPTIGFDVAVTTRCLINLPSLGDQRVAIEHLASVLRPGAPVVLVENFEEGQEGLNAARRSIGLAEIPIRWHNLYFTEQSLLDITLDLFDLISISDFASAYYYATRVIYSGACHLRGETPDYDHAIHRLAVDLPPLGRFSPVRMVVLRRRSTIESGGA